MAPATSVFFGGGTPSLLPVDDLGGILAAIPVVPGAEVTVECNPETVDLGRLQAYRHLGVTRLSFGVQSMVPEVLRALGRTHDPAAVHRAVAAAGAAGFDGAFSVDLIYGAVGESLDDWRRSVTEAVGLDPAPAHVSAYGLTAEPGTPLGRDPARHPDGDDQADKYELADDLLGQAGLEWYELSNWARPGAESWHNRLYWRQGEYRGIGCAAHSHAHTAGGGAPLVERPDPRALPRPRGGRPAHRSGGRGPRRSGAPDRSLPAGPANPRRGGPQRGRRSRAPWPRRAPPVSSTSSPAPAFLVSCSPGRAGSSPTRPPSASPPDPRPLMLAAAPRRLVDPSAGARTGGCSPRARGDAGVAARRLRGSAHPEALQCHVCGDQIEAVRVEIPA